MLIRDVTPNGLLSFGPGFPGIELGPLNVLIGPNGSGKSNLIQVLRLIRALATGTLGELLRQDGALMTDWIWKSARGDQPAGAIFLRARTHSPDARWYVELEITEAGPRFLDERIGSDLDGDPQKFLLSRTVDLATISVSHAQDTMGEISARESILTQYRDPGRLPQLFKLANQLKDVRVYADWTLGRHAGVRKPQPADGPNDFLAEDCSNLGMILSRIEERPSLKRALLEKMRLIYDGLSDVKVSIVGGTVQVYVHEGERRVPATRLSDGTLRWLCLLALAYQPDPPPLAAIEEPELGLHPDLIPTLAELLIEASERMQLVVTTHSDLLVEALSGVPESIIVCERENDSTVMRRLEPKKLKKWLEEYSLGELWRSGEIGGNLW